jgi:hypothetical protein
MLCRVAIGCPQLSYLHLVSGQDYLIRPLPSLLKFFSENRGVNFLDFNKLPNAKWAGGGFNRVCSYHGYDLIDSKSRVGHIMLSALHTVTKLKLFRRRYNGNLPPLFGGSTWWSLTRKCVQYVVRASDDDPSFLNRLRYCFCPEELFFQTMVLNSPFRNQVHNDCLRYIDWRYQHGSCPAILDPTDYPSLVQSTKFFARKFDSQWSTSLIQSLQSSSRAS